MLIKDLGDLVFNMLLIKIYNTYKYLFCVVKISWYYSFNHYDILHYLDTIFIIYLCLVKKPMREYPIEEGSTSATFDIEGSYQYQLSELNQINQLSEPNQFSQYSELSQLNQFSELSQLNLTQLFSSSLGKSSYNTKGLKKN
jgi:hypothetical protein